MDRKSKFVSVPKKREVRNKMVRLRRLLGDAGYWVFWVGGKRRRTSFDIMVVKKDNPLVPLWLYPTKTGRVVVRPWRARKGASQELYRHITRKDRQSLKLFRSVPMPKTTTWYDWLTLECQKEAKLLNLPI